MSDKNEMLVQAFVNITYNQGGPDGNSKYGWGFGKFDLSEGSAPLIDQIMNRFDLSKDNTFNLNLTAFTPVIN